MPFAPGNKAASNRKHARGGRPNREKMKLKALAAQIAREYIEKHVEKVLKTYLELAAGRWVTHRQYDANKGKVITFKEFEVDGPTLRHYVDKILPMAQPGQLPVQPVVQLTATVDATQPVDHYKGAVEVIRQLVKAGVMPADAFARLTLGDNGNSGNGGPVVQ